MHLYKVRVSGTILKRIVTLLCATLFFCSHALAGNMKSLVIFARQPETEFTTEQQHWQDLASRAQEYFRDQLAGELSVEFCMGPVVSLKKSYNNSSVQAAVLEAVKLASSIIDLSEFDADQDKLIDNVTVIFSGEEIWPQNSNCNSIASFAGKQLCNFTALSEYFQQEPLSLGIFCHEFCHALGLPDLYDTDEEGSKGKSESLWGSLDLMDMGDRNNSANTPAGLSAIELDLLGIGSRDTISIGEHSLEPLGSSHNYMVLPCMGKDEYFLLECRAAIGWDQFIGGEGLLLYHIDKSSNLAGFSTMFGRELTAYERWTLNPAQVNCNPLHQCADLMEANPDAQTVADVFYRSGSIGAGSPTALRSWDGAPYELAITGIEIDGQGVAHFSVIRPIEILRIDTYQTACLLQWKADESLRESIQGCSIKWSRAGKLLGSAECSMGSDGIFSILIEGLEPSTSYLEMAYYNIEIALQCNDAVYCAGSTIATEFFDQRNNRPYIPLRNIERSADGKFIAGTSIPLIVYNATDAVSIEWSFDGMPIKESRTRQDSSFIVEQSGTLRASVEWPDGTVSVITKKINVAEEEAPEQ